MRGWRASRRRLFKLNIERWKLKIRSLRRCECLIYDRRSKHNRNTALFHPPTNNKHRREPIENSKFRSSSATLSKCTLIVFPSFALSCVHFRFIVHAPEIQTTSTVQRWVVYDIPIFPFAKSLRLFRHPKNNNSHSAPSFVRFDFNECVLSATISRKNTKQRVLHFPSSFADGWQQKNAVERAELEKTLVPFEPRGKCLKTGPFYNFFSSIAKKMHRMAKIFGAFPD